MLQREEQLLPGDGVVPAQEERVGLTLSPASAAASVSSNAAVSHSLYLTLVLGNVNVTLLDKQAK